MITQEKINELNIVAQILTEHDSEFPTKKEALERLLSDYPKGYPTDAWIASVLGAHEKGTLLGVWVDSSTGNYHGNWTR